MTADQLQSIVLRLANQVPTRYWLHFNYPARGPWLMALKIYHPGGWGRERAKALKGQLRERGGEWDMRAGVWTFERTFEDGGPFTGDP